MLLLQRPWEGHPGRKDPDSGLSFVGIKRSAQSASGRQLGFIRPLKIKAETATASASPAACMREPRGSPGGDGGRRSGQTNGGGGLPASQPEEGRPGTCWGGGGAGSHQQFPPRSRWKAFLAERGNCLFCFGGFFFARPGNGLSSVGAPGLTEEE